MTTPGVPSDALDAIVHPAGPKPDPDVTTAFAMGWQLGLAGSGSTATSPETSLPLGPPDRALSRAPRFAPGYKLDARLRAAGQQPTDIDGKLTTLRDAPSRDSSEAADAEILQQFYAADLRLGKALRLGRLVYALTTLERSENIAGALTAYQAREQAVDLAPTSVLPENAAHSVKNSLLLWCEAKRRDDDAAPLLEQGVRWRPVLSGETAAKDVLKLRDYVGTVESLMERLLGLAMRGQEVLVDRRGGVRPARRGHRAHRSRQGRHRARGSGQHPGGVRCAWKALGGLLGRATAGGGDALWAAQLDWTIAYRLTALQTPQPKSIAKGDEHVHLRKLAEWQRRKPVRDNQGLRSASRQAQALAAWARPPPASCGCPRPRAGMSTLRGRLRARRVVARAMGSREWA